MRTFTITDLTRLDRVMTAVKQVIRDALVGGPVVIECRRQSRSLEQNSKIHAMLRDISRTVEIDGKHWSQDVWKALAMDSFEQELRSMGEGLRHPSRVVISLDGERAVTIRASTTDLLKAEAGDFITYLYKLGTEYGAKFSEQSLAIYEEYREAA
jgi:hypothetical protein